MHKINLLRSKLDLHHDNITLHFEPSMIQQAATARDPQHTRYPYEHFKHA